jgi:hypothetical protein
MGCFSSTNQNPKPSEDSNTKAETSPDLKEEEPTARINLPQMDINDF